MIPAGTASLYPIPESSASIKMEPLVELTKPAIRHLDNGRSESQTSTSRVAPCHYLDLA